MDRCVIRFRLTNKFHKMVSSKPVWFLFFPATIAFIKFFPHSFDNHVCSYSLQFYLPPESLVNKDFLKDVLVGKKQLMKKSAIKSIEVPHYEEISVKALYPEFKKDAEMMSYFPDKYPAGKAPPREYFFNILNTIYPEYLQEVMLHASKQRMTTEGEAMKKESIKMTEFWEE